MSASGNITGGCTLGSGLCLSLLLFPRKSLSCFPSAEDFPTASQTPLIGAVRNSTGNPGPERPAASAAASPARLNGLLIASDRNYPVGGAGSLNSTVINSRSS